MAEIVEIHRRQVLTQLGLAGLHTGLIVNFNVVVLTDGGGKRVVNPAASARWPVGPATPSNLR